MKQGICPECHKKFDYTKGKKIFCSRACYLIKWHKGRIIKEDFNKTKSLWSLLKQSLTRLINHFPYKGNI